jgi:hypothetical protein
MWNRTAARLGLALASVALMSACAENPCHPDILEPAMARSPGDVLFGQSSLQRGPPATLDDHARLNEKVPGFAGMYRDGQGAMIAVKARGPSMQLSHAAFAAQVRNQKR